MSTNSGAVQYDTLRQNVEALLEKPREAEPQRQRNNELE